MRPPQPYQKEAITVAEIIEQLRRLAGVEVEPANAAPAENRPLTESHVHRPGTALTPASRHPSGTIFGSSRI